VGWLASEVDAWIASRALSSNAPGAEARGSCFPPLSRNRVDLPIEVDDATIEAVAKLLDRMEAEFRSLSAEFSGSSSS